MSCSGFYRKMQLASGKVVTVIIIFNASSSKVREIVEELKRKHGSIIKDLTVLPEVML